MSEPWNGGCACGALRYSLTSEPYDCGWCHCSICRLSSGAPALVFATVPRADFRIDSGHDRGKWFASSSFGRRLICGECGTLLAIEVDYAPGEIDFTVATLDDPERVEPGFHIFYASRIGWFEPGDELPRHDRSRPGTKAPQAR